MTPASPNAFENQLQAVYGLYTLLTNERIGYLELFQELSRRPMITIYVSTVDRRKSLKVVDSVYTC